jgi:hypothetical protein
MQVWVAEGAIRQKYGTAWAGKIGQAMAELGPRTDVTGKSPDEIRALIARAPANEAHVLVGGYDVIPPFVRPNPSLNLSGDDDATIPTDGPYGATPGSAAEEVVPSRIVARIPDATGTADGAAFIKLLRFQAQATKLPTPPKRFEECAAEFSAASLAVGKAMGRGKSTLVKSPPAKLDGAPDVIRRLTGAGRVHVLLHGANYSPDWAYLFGHAARASESDYPRALSARQIDLCDLRGAVVTFSSCYAAMLDGGDSEAASRSEANQVALACLGHGAKVVVAATRSNWISLMDDADGLGPGLVAETWRGLVAGKKAGAALRDARVAFVKKALSMGGASERPYVLKTALQMHLYGNPDATL